MSPEFTDAPLNSNILILLSDQLRRQALGCYGDPDARTPNIDMLAQSGVKFTNACSTFRFTFMTGLYAHTRLVPVIEWAMSPAERTLADEFNDAAFETIYIGKWHLDGGHARMDSARAVCLTPVPREHQGRWQQWYGFELRNDPYDTYYFHNGDPAPVRLGKYQTDGLFDLAMDYLAARRDRSRRFCMCVSVEPPHEPFVPPVELRAIWDETEIRLPPNFHARNKAHREQLIRQRKYYYAMVENLDANVGRMLAFLRERDLAGSTIVIFLSDHGELNGSHGHSGKRWPYEESIGIPLVVRDPSVTERRGVCVDEPVCTEDLFPTILGLAGIKPKHAVTGADLSPLIRGETAELGRPGILLEFVRELRKGFTFYDETWRGFRSRRFKYTVLGNRSGAKPWQFFDLENDPYELHNLVRDERYREEIARHHGWLCDCVRNTGDRYALAPAFGFSALNLCE